MFSSAYTAMYEQTEAENEGMKSSVWQKDLR